MTTYHYCDTVSISNHREEGKAMINYLNKHKIDLYNGEKVTWRGRVFWANMTTKEIYAHSIDEELAGSVSGYEVAIIDDDWNILKA